MSDVSYAGLAPFIYNDALADDAPRVRKLLQTREIKNNASLLRQLSALLQALSWTMPGARKAWGQMLKESEAWRTAKDHFLQHSKVSLTEEPRMGEKPGDEMRGIQSLFPEQRAELTMSAARIRFPQDLQLVRCRKTSAGMTRRHFRVGRGRRGHALDRGRPSAKGRLASLVAPSLRLSHDRLVHQHRGDLAHRRPDTSPP